MTRDAAAAPLRVEPVTPARWDDLAELFERRGPRGGTGAPYNCWCMWWRARTGNRDKNKVAMRRLVRGGREPGLLAYDGDVAVGWVSVAPREHYGQLVRSRTYRPEDGLEGVWSIVCLFVHPTARRGGVARELLRGAVEHALARGATAVEAYPSESAGDYMGKREHLDELGFAPVRRAGKRTVMQHGATDRARSGRRVGRRD
jgi:GNAT superfamily N-acetyltransferase